MNVLDYVKAELVRKELVVKGEIETLKKVNSELISTISETIKIQDEGRQKRLSAEKDLVAMETEIKNKLLEAKG